MQAIARGLERSGRPLLHGLAPLAWIFSGLALAWGLWWSAFWPGVLGQDSLAILLQMENPHFQSNKPVVWALFVQALYGPARRVEPVIGLQLLVGALAFSRILAWCWREKLRKSCAFILLFVCLSPAVLYYESALYSDGPFAVAAAGLVFEAWLIVRERRLGRGRLAWLALLLPFALFFRANGIYLLLLFVPVLWVLDRRGRMAVLAVLLAWLALAGLARRANDQWSQHETLYPLALFETVNFMQPRPMGLRPLGDRVTARTVDILERHRPLPAILPFYDRDYWDPLAYDPRGPQMLAMPKPDRKALVREFLCCNLWRNLPAFAASRVNVFGVALLAQGGFAHPDEAAALLAQTKSESRAAPGVLRPLLQGFYDWSFSVRWLAWSPLPGLVLLGALAVRGARRRDWLLVLLMAPLGLQLAGIFLFSIAGEYRYLLPFLTCTAALLPIYVVTRQAGAPAP